MQSDLTSQHLKDSSMGKRKSIGKGVSHVGERIALKVDLLEKQANKELRELSYDHS